MPKIVSRLFAAAFNLNETIEDVVFMECQGCPNNVHAVVKQFDTEGDGYDWQMKHNQATGHTNFSVFRMQRSQARLYAGK